MRQQKTFRYRDSNPGLRSVSRTHVGSMRILYPDRLDYSERLVVPGEHLCDITMKLIADQGYRAAEFRVAKCKGRTRWDRARGRLA